MAKSKLPQIDLFEESRRKLRQTYILTILKKATDLQLSAFETLLAQGRIEDAVHALGLDNTLIDDMVDELRIAYRQQGQIAIDQLRVPPEIAKVRQGAFTFAILGNPRAEQWIQTTSSRLIVDVVEQQKQLARSLITENLSRGQNPRSVSQQLVGYWNHATRRREGGILGLTRKQAEWIDNAARELRGSGMDPLLPADRDGLARYLGRQLRDKRFDRSVHKALREDKPIPANTRNKMVRHYRGKFLRYRGEVIGRTEQLRAMNAARTDAMKTVVDQGGIKNRENVQRIWRATLGSVRTRDTHAAASGQSRGLDEKFEVGRALLDYPGDPSGPPEETIQCRCYLQNKVNWIAEALLDV